MVTDDQNEKNSTTDEDSADPENYGWSFHKVPLLLAAIFTVVFYLVIWLVFG
jgi:hypothetical protein